MPHEYRPRSNATHQAHRWDPDDLVAVGEVVTWLEINGLELEVTPRAEMRFRRRGSSFSMVARPGQWVVRTPDGLGWQIFDDDRFAEAFESAG